MDLIIRLIINIFKEIFEQDSKRRQAEKARRERILRQWHLQQQAQRQKAGQHRTHQGGANAPPAPPQAQAGPLPSQTQAVPPPKPKLVQQLEALFGEMDVAPPPPPPPVSEPEDVQQVPKPRTAIKAKSSRAPEMVVQKPVAKRKRSFKIPGDTPLKKMILAKVILDPPKALKDDLI